MLAVMFYLGSLVRYQPHVYDHLLGTDIAYVLESFVRQVPVVFAYLMLNHLWHVEHYFEVVPRPYEHPHSETPSVAEP